ncbi:hypothetical protein L195_g060872, partial [Trifolium pratense]
MKPVLRRSCGGDERNVNCGWNYGVERTGAILTLLLWM